MNGADLTFNVKVLEGDLNGADGPAAVFIDIIGLPRTPLSFAGVARRTAWRGAFYRPVHTIHYLWRRGGGGARRGGGRGGGRRHYHPYPYYAPPPPACGYYPYPPCY